MGWRMEDGTHLCRSGVVAWVGGGEGAGTQCVGVLSASAPNKDDPDTRVSAASSPFASLVWYGSPLPPLVPLPHAVVPLSGHRASAEALVAAFHEAYPDRVSTWVVDLFTDIAGPPFGRLPSQYAFLAARPPLWRAVWEYGRFPPTRAATEAFTTAVSGGAVTDAIRAYAPDLILSVHPLCQTLVLHALERLEPRRRRGRLPRPPFVTVVTDLGGAHPTWFDPAVDRLFVPSDAVAAIAARCGVSAVKTRQLGLPVRSPFWGPPAANGGPAAGPAVDGAPAAAPGAGVSALGAGVGGGTTANGNGTTVAPPRPPVRRAVSDTYYALDGPGKQSAQPLLASPAKRVTRLALGLHPDVPTVLVVGGGDGVGGLAAIVPALTAALGASSAAAATDGAAPVAQVLVVCGKNEAVRRRVAAAPAVPRVSLTVTGFVTNMADWMGAADCLVTKAGPGTIAEALICGLPMVLSAYLPGQEAPNVPFVVEGGVGVYRRRPREIAAIVAGWFADPTKLECMSARALALGRANASRDIARSIGEMIPW